MNKVFAGFLQIGEVIFHMEESGEVICIFILLAGGELCYEAVEAICSFTQTHVTQRPSDRKQSWLEQASTLFPVSVWLWNTAQGDCVSIGFCSDHSSTVFISTNVKYLHVLSSSRQDLEVAVCLLSAPHTTAL